MVPSTHKLAPVVICCSVSAEICCGAKTTCRWWMVEPSLSVMNTTCLLVRLVLTQPLTQTSAPIALAVSNDLILVLFTR